MTFRYMPFKLNSQKRNVLSRTSEREFDREVKKIDQLQESTAKIQESAKKCIKSHTAKAKCEADLAEGLQGGISAKDDERFRRLVELSVQSAKQLNAQNQEISSVLSKSMVEPMKRYSNLFPAMQLAIKKREHSLQEFVKCQEKVEKYLKRERTGLNAVKLENSRKSCAAAKLDFDGVNDALMEDIQVLCKHRNYYFHPCLQAFVEAENNYYKNDEQIHANACREIQNLYSDLLQDSTVPPPDLLEPSKPSKASNKESTSDLSDSEEESFILESIKKKLSEIKALSITVDDHTNK